MRALTRREVLALGLALPATRIIALGAHAQGLGGFTTTAGAPPVCTNTREATPATREDGYKANAPERTSLREPGMTGTLLRLSGSVLGLRCGAIKDARVEYWQADGDGRYDAAGFRLRGQQRTNAQGAFAIDTVVPGAAPGRGRQIHLRVTPPNHAPLATSVFFPDDPARTKDPDFKPSLVVTFAPSTTVKTATFDVVFDL
jgi:protocatechuate 3,4-dioxygenase beta subunit